MKNLLLIMCFGLLMSISSINGYSSVVDEGISNVVSQDDATTISPVQFDYVSQVFMVDVVGVPTPTLGVYSSPTGIVPHLYKGTNPTVMPRPPDVRCLKTEGSNKEKV